MNKLILLLCLLAVPALADDHAEIVERAFGALSRDFDESWAYTQSSTEEDRALVARYDPRSVGVERWTLMTINGRQPTDDEIDEFRARKAAEDDTEAEKGEHDNGEPGAMVTPGSLRLLEETPTHWLFSFMPIDDEEEDEAARKFMKHVDGTVKVVKDGHYVEYIDLRNRKPIKPMMGVKIKKFLTRLTFGPAAAGGPIVPLSVDVSIKGRAFLAVKFDENESVNFSDWEYAGE